MNKDTLRVLEAIYRYGLLSTHDMMVFSGLDREETLSAVKSLLDSELIAVQRTSAAGALSMTYAAPLPSRLTDIKKLLGV